MIETQRVIKNRKKNMEVMGFARPQPNAKLRKGEGDEGTRGRLWYKQPELSWTATGGS